jgi:REP element-mobilizing transposase RayT
MSNYRDEFLDDTYYLISNKWFNNSILFENSDDYKTFILYVISNLLDHTWIIISAYCILPQHFHFVIKNKDKWFKISDFMRKIQVSYAMYLKSKQNNESRWLPVFEWRFKANVINLDDLEYIESCVAFDPVRHESIENIKNWPYTSAHQLIDTWYDYITQTHIKIYNDWRKIQKRFFEDGEHI